MARMFTLKRRKKVSLFKWAIVLLALTVACIGCSDSDDDDNSTPTPEPEVGVSFAPVEVPTTDEAKRQVQATQSITIDGESYDIDYHVLMRSGDVIGGDTFGQILDQNGDPTLQTDGSEFISNDNDFSSLIPKGERLFNVTHFESRPGAMYLTELAQDAETGMLTPISTKNIDFSAFGGLWVPCAGSVTPWNTHLGSEEYPPDARTVEETETIEEADVSDDWEYWRPMLRYFGIADPFADSVTIEQIKETFNPYLYGFPVEVTLDDSGNATVEKRYAMGRMALELAYVMPDQKTAYLSDDGTNVGFFMFVANTAGDLTAGKLYAAKWAQTSADNGGAAELEWVALGSATQSEIKTAIDDGTVFSDLFETADANEDDTCPEGFTSINTEPGHECLKLKDGMGMLASRLETRRYAAMLGATTEFRKEEGITFDPDDSKLYVAMSEVARGMENNMKNGEANDKYDVGGYNHIQLPYNTCGTVYELDVSADSAIGSDYVAKNMQGLVSGIMTEYAEGSPYAGNTCDVDGIANPDNLTFINGKDILIIGEDTGSGHQNDAVWAYDLPTGELTRIQTTPYGSETTSPYWYPNINNWAYLMGVIQHPYGESDEDKLTDESDAAAYVGYTGPIPAMD